MASTKAIARTGRVSLCTQVDPIRVNISEGFMDLRDTLVLQARNTHTHTHAGGCDQSDWLSHGIDCGPPTELLDIQLQAEDPILRGTITLSSYPF